MCVYVCVLVLPQTRIREQEKDCKPKATSKLGFRVGVDEHISK